MSRANALVAKVRRLDAAMQGTLVKVGDLAAERRMAVAELVEVVGNVQRTADLLGISRSSVYKALRGV